MESVLEEEGEQEGSSLSACVRECACVWVCASAVRGHSPAFLSASDWMDAGCAGRRKRSAPPALTVKRGEGAGVGSEGGGGGDPRMEPYGNQVSSAGAVAEPIFFFP